jgi:predicted amidohydrolase YtcJ
MRSLIFAVAVWMSCFQPCLLRGQEVPEIILYGGKVVTVDNHAVDSNLGTIAQAVAIREGRILAIGSDTEIRPLGDESTQFLDLQGKTLMPGFAGTHDHPTDWDPLNPSIIRKVVSDDLHIERFLEDPPEEQARKFPQVLREAVQKAKPGQWIRISLLFGKEYRWGRQIQSFLGSVISKAQLDVAAPENPVLVRAGFTGLVFNQAALNRLKEHYGPAWDRFDPDGNPLAVGVGDTEERVLRTGVCSVCYRYFEQDVLYPPEVLQEIYRLGLSWMAGYGQTLNSSNLYTAGAIAAYHALDRKDAMPIRLSWTWYWPPRKDFFLDPYFSSGLVAMSGRGSDYLWLTGGNPATNLKGCSTLPGTSPEVKKREQRSGCGYGEDTAAGRLNREVMASWIRAGGRLAGDHTGGDGDIDHVLDVIEEASREAGMTLEEVRAKRHAFDHMTMNPRPDQIPRLKYLGMMTGGTNLQVWEGGAERVFQNYGERAVEWVQPRRNLIEAGVMNSVEIDRPIGYTNLTFFHVLYTGITREDQNGQTWGSRQAISREAMLKAATIWGAYYSMREKELGSLEPGKRADLIVIDRDYLTVPEKEILSLRVLMTLVEGKMVHLAPSLAGEWGLQPTGAQVELGGPASKW